MERSEQNYAEALNAFNQLFEGEDSAVATYEQLRHLWYYSANDEFKPFLKARSEFGTGGVLMLGYFHDALNVYHLRNDGLEKETSRLLDPGSEHIQAIRSHLAEMKALLTDESLLNLTEKQIVATEQNSAELREDYKSYDPLPDLIAHHIKKNEADLLVLERLKNHKEDYITSIEHIEEKLKKLQETVPLTRAVSADDLSVIGYGDGLVMREYGEIPSTKAKQWPQHRDCIWETSLAGVGNMMTGGDNLYVDFLHDQKKPVHIDYCLIDEDGKAWRFNAGSSDNKKGGAQAIIHDLMNQYCEFSSEDFHQTFDEQGFVEALKAKLPELVEKYPPLVIPPTPAQIKDNQWKIG